MKKIAAALVVVGVAVGGIGYVYVNTPKRRLCIKMGDLCGGKGDEKGHYDDWSDCVDSLEDIEEVVGEKPIENAAICVDDAESCIEGMGCVAGVAANEVDKGLKSFQKGYDRGRK